MRRVKVSYVKAARSPGERTIAKEAHPDFIPPMKAPTGLSPLAQYLEENSDSGLSKQELVEQFQEYDCKHTLELTCRSSRKEIKTCSNCGLVVTKELK